MEQQTLHAASHVESTVLLMLEQFAQHTLFSADDNEPTFQPPAQQDAIPSKGATPVAPAIKPTQELLDGTASPGTVITSVSPSGQPNGLTPEQIRKAYGIDQITFDNGSVQGNGAGQTIAIVDAYNQPNLNSDLQTFDSEYGLPAPPSFTIVNQTGGTTLPIADDGWGGEETLDVEWAHAIAPQANIVLVEANSSSMSDLLTAVSYARNMPNVSVVSMSWGSNSGELSNETSLDSNFTTPSGHEGVTFVGATGDNGSNPNFEPEYPSTSPNVLAVGGTVLSVASDGTYASESGWSNSGGGLSVYEPQPNYQNGVVTQSSTQRAVPDVSLGRVDVASCSV